MSLAVLPADVAAELEAARAFRYAVTHDLRAPLRSLAGSASLLVAGHADQLAGPARDCLDRIQASADELTQMLSALLTLSDLEDQELRRCSIDMHAMVMDCWSAVPGAAARTSLTVHELPRAHADRAMVGQLWTSLLENAVRFSERCARPRVTVRADEDGGEVAYTVGDNGVGFDSAHADGLFQPFHTEHAAADLPGRHGLGVGLAAAHEIVARHGGRIWAQSSPGQGARLSFTLGVEATSRQP